MMLLVNLVLFIVSFFVLVKSAEYGIKYSSKVARVFHLSEFIVSFFVVSLISCSPEATISIISALNGIPEFGLGTLIGSNVADLALVFGIVALFSKNGVVVKSEILKSDLFYLVLLLVPLIVGYDGHLSQIDGIILILSGAIFFFTLYTQRTRFKKVFNGVHSKEWIVNFLLLIISICFMVVGAYYTVEYGVNLAQDIGIPSFFIAITLVAIGSCVPELIFSIKAVTSNHEELALGDVFGTVIIDATFLVGILALISPFSFNPMIIYVTASMMFLAGVLVIFFLRSEKILTKNEGIYLLLFYILYLIIESILNGRIV